MATKIALAGPRGKMGTEAIKMITNNSQFELVACIDRKNDGKTLSDISHPSDLPIPIYERIEQCFNELDIDVYVDLTVPQVGFEYTKIALQNNIRAVVGTSGLTQEQIDDLSTIAEEHSVGCIIAPNFALGAVLMMLFSKIAAKYFQDVEIIEKHHDQKIDAPSGTALKTVEMIKQARGERQQGHPDEYEIYEGARGANLDGIRVHSMRLPGLVAHQEVIFGSKSQLFTIKHDSFHRESFMDGLKLAIEEVVHLNKLVYGLEHVMDLD